MVFVLVSIYALAFGLIGLAVGRRQQSALTGALLGYFLGPVGVGLLWFTQP